MSQLKTNTTNLQTLLNKANALPQHLNTSDATATADEILLNETAYVNGSKLTGTMPNNGAISSTMDGISTKSVTVPAGYTSGGTVSLDDTIDNKVDNQADLISQIQTALVGKTGNSGEDVSTEVGVYTSLLTNLETAIEELPDAGSGSIEISTVTFSGDNTYNVWYTNENGVPSYIRIVSSGEITVQKGSLMAVSWEINPLTEGNTSGLTALNTWSSGSVIAEGEYLHSVNVFIFYIVANSMASFYLNRD